MIAFAMIKERQSFKMAQAYHPDFPQTPFGGLYPTNFVVGVFDDLSEAKAAVDDFLAANYDVGTVRLMDAQESIDKLHELDQHKNILQQILGSLHIADKKTGAATLQSAVNQGQHLLYVRACDTKFRTCSLDEVKQIHVLMEKHHGHTVRFFGPWWIEDIHPTHPHSSEEAAAADRGMTTEEVIAKATPRHEDRVLKVETTSPAGSLPQQVRAHMPPLVEHSPTTFTGTAAKIEAKTPAHATTHVEDMPHVGDPLQVSVPPRPASPAISKPRMKPSPSSNIHLHSLAASSTITPEPDILDTRAEDMLSEGGMSTLQVSAASTFDDIDLEDQQINEEEAEYFRKQQDFQQSRRMTQIAPKEAMTPSALASQTTPDAMDTDLEGTQTEIDQSPDNTTGKSANQRFKYSHAWRRQQQHSQHGGLTQH